MMIRGVHPRTHTGHAYVVQITAGAADRRTRAAFQALVPRWVVPGGHLFDFGAGPGIDALHFARAGFTVHAFDVDPEMRRCFIERCAGALRDGAAITLEGGEYRDFLERPRPDLDGRIDLVIANFAPLNLIEDLPALFVRLDRLVHPRGRVLASVLNPFFWDDMRHRWWWRRLPELRRAGHYFMPGPTAPHFRRRLRDLSAQAEPAFRLTRVFPGLPVRRAAGARGVPYPPGRSLALPWGRFLFVLFEKPCVSE